MTRLLLGALASMALAGACSNTTSSPDDGGDPPGSTVGGGHPGGGGDGGAVGNGSTGSAGTGGDAGVDPGCDGGEPFDPGALVATVGYLASDELAGRAPGTPGDEAARAYIEARFGCLGLTPAGADGTYQQPFVTSSGVTTKNVVGYVPGSDPTLASEIIVVGAHHDHLGMIGGEIHPGANDNASGVAALLAMAHALTRRDAAPKRTVAFVAFGYEEHDGECEGSEFYVGSAPAALPIDRVVYTVITDMVGVYPLEKSLTAYGSFAGTPGRAVLDGLAGQHPGLNLDLGVAADEDASDFQAFYNLGIPYVYFETWDEPCWHKPCDKADRIDAASMAEVATLAFEVVVGLADGTADLTTKQP